MGVVFLVLVAVVLVGVVMFLRAVFGGSTFPREPRPRGRRDDDGGRRPRPDVHPGATRWTGGGGLGTWGTWNHGGSAGGSDGGGGDGGGGC